jgi:hypothetical protein
LQPGTTVYSRNAGYHTYQLINAIAMHDGERVNAQKEKKKTCEYRYEKERPAEKKSQDKIAKSPGMETGKQDSSRLRRRRVFS